MKRTSRRYLNRPVLRIMPALACLAALALTGCAGSITSAPGKHHGGRQHAAPKQPAAPRPVLKQPGAAMSSAARCNSAYLRTNLHLADATVDSAAMNTSGTVTPTFPQPL